MMTDTSLLPRLLDVIERLPTTDANAPVVNVREILIEATKAHCRDQDMLLAEPVIVAAVDEHLTQNHSLTTSPSPADARIPPGAFGWWRPRSMQAWTLRLAMTQHGPVAWLAWVESLWFEHREVAWVVMTGVTTLVLSTDAAWASWDWLSSTAKPAALLVGAVVACVMMFPTYFGSKALTRWGERTQQRLQVARPWAEGWNEKAWLKWASTRQYVRHCLDTDVPLLKRDIEHLQQLISVEMRKADLQGTIEDRREVANRLRTLFPNQSQAKRISSAP